MGELSKSIEKLTSHSAKCGEACSLQGETHAGLAVYSSNSFMQQMPAAVSDPFLHSGYYPHWLQEMVHKLSCCSEPNVNRRQAIQAKQCSEDNGSTRDAKVHVQSNRRFPW